jgi:hypothetical protein
MRDADLPRAEGVSDGGESKTASRDDMQRHPCGCGDALVQGSAPGEFRCACGALLGRREGDQFELLCRRCKRRVVLVVKEVRS